MFQMINNTVSDDKLTCQSFGIVSTIGNQIIACLSSINSAYSFVKQIIASTTSTAIVTGITEVIKELTQDLSGEVNLNRGKYLNQFIVHDSSLRVLMLAQRNEDVIRSKILVFLNFFKRIYEKEIESFNWSFKTLKEAQPLGKEVF